jgi:hypothetical protein
MRIREIVNTSLRLFFAPIKGAFAGMNEAYSRPAAAHWKQFILDDVRRYFSPVTGAIEGVKKELSRREKT